MSKALYLVLDQGGQSSRALIFNTHGQLLKQARYKIKTHTPQPSHVEHDAGEMLTSLRTVTHDVIQQLGQDKHHIIAAGIACQRSSIVCWHRDSGETLSPIISWQDTRAAEWLNQFEIHASDIHQRSGLFLSAHYGASKLRWCLDNIAAVQAAQQNNTLVLGPLASFLAFSLCEEKPILADPANAARTLLWNLKNQNWDTKLLALFGIEQSHLPVCTQSRSAWGHLNIDSLRIPLTIVTGDQSAALFCNGTPDANSVYINIGTGAFAQQPTSSAPQSPTQLCSVVHTETDYKQYVTEGTVNGAASALKWLTEQHHIEIEQLKLKDWLNDYNHQSANVPLFINSIAGLGSPWWRNDITPQFIGGTQSVELQAVALIESIVFMLAFNLRLFTQHQQNFRQIYISGGLSQLDGLCQRIADLCGYPTLRTEQAEATGRGLAYLLAGRSQEFHIDHTQLFKPSNNNALQARYDHWQRLMPPFTR